SHRRHRDEIEPLHGLGGGARDTDVLLRRGATHPIEPIEIGAGLEMPAFALDDDCSQPGYCAESIHRRQQALDKVAIISVIDRGAIESERCDLALIDLQEHGFGLVRIHHVATLYEGGTARDVSV